MSTRTSQAAAAATGRHLLNKVPEVTIWFWIIKILCTTVGESFADWINMTLGVGLTNTSLIFTGVFAVVLFAQFKTDRYVPFVYWLTVVVVSVTGTLYTDILTDNKGVPLRVSSAVFSALLVVVFGVWYARERTLSIHSIVTFPREAFYWLAVLVTFALGTATGDWTLELTGWGPGKSVILPAALIAIITVGWKLGANPVLAFWLAYILTRPLGANLGDWFATPKSERGLGLGTAGTSVIFLGAIAATVAYLTLTRADVTSEEQLAADARRGPAVRDMLRERVVLCAYSAAAIVTGLVLHHASTQPHSNPLADEGEGPSTPVQQLSPQAATAHFPAADIGNFQTIAKDTLAKLDGNDQAGATARVKDLETAWDEDESKLKPQDSTAWTFIDSEIDGVLTAVRAKSPVVADEKAVLTTLITTLSGGGSDHPTAAAPTAAPVAVDATKATAKFPPAEIDKFRSITKDTLAKLGAGQQAAATARIKDLETAWDDAQAGLQPKDPASWTLLDGQIDDVLSALRAKKPVVADEKAALQTLLKTLGT